MENTMTSALKALVAQVGGNAKNAQPSTTKKNSNTVRVADIRRDADEAKDTLRHSLRS